MLRVTPWPNLPSRWLVRYRAQNGLIYTKDVKANTELDAYLRVMGITKEK